MEQNVVARRVALLAGIGATIFYVSNALQEAFWRMVDNSTAPVDYSQSALGVVFVILMVGLAAAYASLVFKDRIGVVAELTAVCAIVLYILLAAPSVFSPEIDDPGSSHAHPSHEGAADD